MKTRSVISIILVGLLIQAPAAWAAKKTADASLNARFVHWQKMPHVVHIFVYNDAGRPGRPPAEAASGQPIVFGYEYGGQSVEELWETIIDNDEFDITLSIDGGTPYSVKDGFQDPFEASSRTGPHWSWDHDGDGPGDKDGDGIGDWDGPMLFFRYMVQGLTPGEHTFTFTILPDNYSETITVMIS
uniref:Uncharacterized protein n=1 Tax=uncultured marine crenarchaeote E6-3G TaxID=907719 RepID=G9BAM3_9ARCH|nr:hypothetical protein E6-3G_24 [uncultured marine crenarchaeote E6-3G]